MATRRQNGAPLRLITRVWRERDLTLRKHAMADDISYAQVREQIRQQAVSIYGACSEQELTVLCRLIFWVLTATDEALARIDQAKLGVVRGLFQAELTRLHEVTIRLAAEARDRGLTDEVLGPTLEALVYREFLQQAYPPEAPQQSAPQ